jgi:hypothetical protein
MRVVQKVSSDTTMHGNGHFEVPDDVKCITVTLQR